MQKAVLFVHGFGGGRYEYVPVAKFLKKHIDIKCYEFCYKENFGQVSLRDIAKKLDDFARKSIIEPEIDAIGFSQGGIVLRYYLKNFGRIKIRKCITLCTPHKGSFTAYLWFLPGAQDLRPKSAIFQELDSIKTEYYAVYNPLDLFVFPGWRAKFNQAKENKKVFALFHPLTFWRKKTLNFILDVLTSKGL